MGNHVFARSNKTELMLRNEVTDVTEVEVCVGLIL